MTTQVNYPNFIERTSGDKQPTVTNNLGRDTEHLEYVSLGGYHGEVKEVTGIANGASGKINIDADRTIETDQIETSDTFVVGDDLWFIPGGSSDRGLLRDADSGGGVKVGIVTDFGGSAGAHTWVQFRPFVQRTS